MKNRWCRRSIDQCLNMVWPGPNNPFVIIVNRVTDEQQDLGDIYPAIVTSDGSVAWYSKRIHTSTCGIDVSNFPWDTQKCNLSFGSWAYDMSGVDLVIASSSAETTAFISNGEWDLDEIPVTRTVTYYSCCKHPYVVVDYTIVISRKPLYYMVNLLIPCITITSVGVMVFCLPVDSGEKISLSVTVLLSGTVFLMLLSDSLPIQSDSVPQVGSSHFCTIFTQYDQWRV